MFMYIVLGTAAVQVLLIEFGGEALRTTNLSLLQHLGCVCIGAGGLAISVCVRASAVSLREHRRQGKEEAPLLSIRTI